MAIIEELKKRYPNGSPFQKLPDLAAANSDLSPKFKAMQNKANELFGMSFVKYLANEGILVKPKKEQKTVISAEERAERRANEYKTKVEEVVSELKKRYPNPSKAPGIMERLRLENSDLPINYLDYWIQKAFKVDAIKYLEEVGIINLKNKQKDSTKLNILKFQQKKTPLQSGKFEFADRVFVATGLEDNQKLEIEKVVMKQGGIYRTCVSKNTDYLIKNPAIPNRFVSPKYKKAKELNAYGLNIQIIDYNEFFNLVEENADSKLSERSFIVSEGTLIRYFGNDTDITIPNDIIEIGNGAFRNCGRIKTVTIPNGVKSIGNNAFQYCSHLEKVDFCGESITSIGKSAFYGCINLKSIILPNSVQTIGERIFVGCASLTSIKLPENIKTIPYGAFRFLAGAVGVYYCPFREIIIPPDVTEIESAAFEYCRSLKKINIPANLKKIQSEDFSGCYELESFSVENENTQYSSDDQGALFNKSKTKLIRLPLGMRKNFFVPNTVRKISERAFSECHYIRNIVFTGDMPLFETTMYEMPGGGEGRWEKCYENFKETKATVYYPKNNSTWARIELRDFGDSIDLMPYDEFESLELFDECSD